MGLKIINSFIWKAKQHTEIEISHSWFTPQMLGWFWMNLGAKNSINIFYVDGRDPTIWAFNTYCFSGCTSVGSWNGEQRQDWTQVLWYGMSQASSQLIHPNWYCLRLGFCRAREWTEILCSFFYWDIDSWHTFSSEYLLILLIRKVSFLWCDLLFFF